MLFKIYTLLYFAINYNVSAIAWLFQTLRLINLNISDTKCRSIVANSMQRLRNCVSQMTVVPHDQPIIDFNRKTILFDRYTGTMIGTYTGNRRELSRNIAEFSTAGKRIIITSVRGVPDNSTVIKDRLPPFVVYIFITNIRKVLPYCIVWTQYGNVRGPSYLLLSTFMRLNARIKFIIRLHQSRGRYIFWSDVEIFTQRNLREKIIYWISNF